MAYEIHLYSFSKKENSTARPSDEGLVLQGVLKEESGIVNPRIRLSMDDPSVAGYNYAYIPNYNRYYFIEDWDFERMWIAVMRCDVMATLKDFIGGSTQYILRSSASSDGRIRDTLYPTRSPISITSHADSGWFDPSAGMYVVGIINKDASSLGCVSYYAMTNSQFNIFKAILLGNFEWVGDIGDIAEGLFKAQFNPFQYIVSCMWFPFSVPVSGGVSPIPVGWWDINATAFNLGGIVASKNTFSISLSKHPQVSRGTYLNNSPYTRITMQFGAWGTIALNADEFANTDNITCYGAVDMITGEGLLIVSNNSNPIANPLVIKKAMIGVPIQLAQISRDYLGMAANAIGGVTGAVSNALTGNIGGVVNSITSGIVGTVESAFPQVQTSGSNGSVVDSFLKPTVIQEFYPIVEEYNEKLGRPLCAPRQINSIPGFIMTSGAALQSGFTRGEMLQAEQMMDGGFYYE